MGTKKELTIADFMNLSVICITIDHSRFLCEETEDDSVNDMWKDLDSMYDIVCSAVTKKDGTIPRYRDLPVSECMVSMSFDTVNDLADKIEDFCMKYKLLDNCDIAKSIIEGIKEPKIELAIECLLGSLVEL